MKPKTILILIAVIMLSSTIFFIASCRKNNAPFIGDAINSSIHRVQDNDGTLQFDSWDDYYEYLDYLSDVAAGDTSLSADTLDFDEKLDLVEDSLGFVSLRHHLHGEAIKMQQHGTFDEDHDPEIHFIADYFIRSTVNVHLQFQIADTTFQYLDENYLAASLDVNDLYGIADIISASHNPDVRLISLNPAHRIESGNALNDISVGTVHDDCDPRAVTFSLHTNGFSGGGYVLYDVDYGDGSTHGTVTQVANIPATISHTYSTTGNYNVFVTGYDNLSGFHSGGTTVPIPNACPASNLSEPAAWAYIGGDYAYKMEHWLSNHGHHYKVQAKTTFYKRNNHGHLVSHHADQIAAQGYNQLIKTSDCTTHFSIAFADWDTHNSTAYFSGDVNDEFRNVDPALDANMIVTDHGVRVSGVWYHTVLHFNNWPCK